MRYGQIVEIWPPARYFTIKVISKIGPHFWTFLMAKIVTTMDTYNYNYPILHISHVYKRSLDESGVE